MTWIVQQATPVAGASPQSASLTGVSSAHELVVIIVGFQASAGQSVTSVVETTTSTNLTQVVPFATAEAEQSGPYQGFAIYKLDSPPASPSITVTMSGGNVAVFVIESSIVGLALDVSSGIEGTQTGTTITTNSVQSSFTNELWLAIAAAAYGGGYTWGSWTNGFVSGGYYKGANAPNCNWAWLQEPSAANLDVSATISSATAANIVLYALKTSTSTQPPILNQINGGLFAPTLGTVTTSTTGGTLSSGPYTYWVTAYDANGETEARNSETVSVASGSTNANSMSWNAVPGAAGYKVYLQYIAPESYFLSYDVGNVTSFTHTAIDETANSIPTAVDTIPAYNTEAPVLTDGATAVPVVGSAFDSTLTIALQQNGITVEQAVTYGSATTATLNVATSNAAGQHLAYSTGVDDPVYPTTAVATTVSVSTGLALPVVLTPAAGLIFKTLGTPHPDQAVRISAIPDFVSGDQLEASGDAAGTTAPPAGTVLHSDGSFEATADFYVRAYIAADRAWTPWTLITVSPAQPGQGFFGEGGV